MCPITSVICSAPSRPLRASDSDSFVNPEMSTNAAVPSSVQHSTGRIVDQVLQQQTRHVRTRAFDGHGHVYD